MSSKVLNGPPDLILFPDGEVCRSSALIFKPRFFMNCTQYHFLSHLFLDSEFLCLVDSSSATGTALNQQNGRSVKIITSCRPACYKEITSTTGEPYRPSQNLHTRQINCCQGIKMGSQLKLLLLLSITIVQTGCNVALKQVFLSSFLLNKQLFHKGDSPFLHMGWAVS